MRTEIMKAEAKPVEHLGVTGVWRDAEKTLLVYLETLSVAMTLARNISLKAKVRVLKGDIPEGVFWLLPLLPSNPQVMIESPVIGRKRPRNARVIKVRSYERIGGTIRGTVLTSDYEAQFYGGHYNEQDFYENYDIEDADEDDVRA